MCPFWGLNQKPKMFAKAPVSPPHYAAAEICSALHLLSCCFLLGFPEFSLHAWFRSQPATWGEPVCRFLIQSSPSFFLQVPATLAALNSDLSAIRLLLLSAITHSSLPCAPQMPTGPPPAPIQWFGKCPQEKPRQMWRSFILLLLLGIVASQILPALHGYSPIPSNSCFLYFFQYL